MKRNCGWKAAVFKRKNSSGSIDKIEKYKYKGENAGNINSKVGNKYCTAKLRTLAGVRFFVQIFSELLPNIFNFRNFSGN